MQFEIEYFFLQISQASSGTRSKIISSFDLTNDIRKIKTGDLEQLEEFVFQEALNNKLLNT